MKTMITLTSMICALRADLQAVAVAPDILLVDDFNRKSMSNKLGGNIGEWKSDPTDSSQWCKVGFDNHSFTGSSGYSLRISYNVASNKTTFIQQDENIPTQELGFHDVAFNGVYMSLKDLDASSYRYLVFYAKGDKNQGFTRKFKLELKDEKRSAAVFIEGVTSHWKQFTVSLDQFSSWIQLDKLRELTIVFDQNVTLPKGVIYLDDVYFAKNLQPAQKGPKNIYADWTDIPPTIDGNLEEWKGAAPAKLDPAKNLESGKIKNEKDLSAEFYFRWDSQYLYFAIHVNDNEVVCLKSGRDLYLNDAVELYIDPGNDGLIWGNEDDYQIGFSPSSPNGTAQCYSWFQNKVPSESEVRFAGKVVKGGYNIEAAIAWKFLKKEVENSKGGEEPEIGVSVGVHDLDLKDDTRTGKLVWNFDKNPKDPAKFLLGTLTLLKK